MRAIRGKSQKSGLSKGIQQNKRFCAGGLVRPPQPDNVNILRSLLTKLNLDIHPGKLQARKQRGKSSLSHPQGSAKLRSQVPPIPPPLSAHKSDQINNDNMERALIDYSDLKDSFYHDKLENARYVKNVLRVCNTIK